MQGCGSCEREAQQGQLQLYVKKDLIGDEAYAGRARARHADPDLKALVSGLGGVALHAAGLAFVHPQTGEPCEFSSPLPNRIEGVLCHLRNHPG